MFTNILIFKSNHFLPQKIEKNKFIKINKILIFIEISKNQNFKLPLKNKFHFFWPYFNFKYL